MTTVDPLQVATHFAVGGEILSVVPHGQGLINDTYLVTVAAQPITLAILQRINPRVFTHAQDVMQNLRTLSDHIGALDLPDSSFTHARLHWPRLYRTHDGADFFTDAHGACWRVQEFISHSRTLRQLPNLDAAKNVGSALGQFHTQLSTLPIARLHVTLPEFHITPIYLARFDAVRKNDAVLMDCHDFVDQHRDLAAILENAKSAGALQLRPTHGDPKLDNFLFAVESNAVLSLIDLDTVQPGLIHYDLGDCLRSCCNRAGEAAQDPDTVNFDLDIAAAILTGYIPAAKAFMTRADFALLYDAIRLIPFELGLRFLTDHLQGDVYFKTQFPNQNLRRARIQFALTKSIEQNEQPLRQIIGTHIAV